MGKINVGYSKPMLVEASDFNKYVLKIKENIVSPKILVNELICCRLAELIGLPVPKAEILYLPQELIEYEEELKNIKVSEGMHFGSLYYSSTVSFTGERSLQNISNIEDIPKIIAFDLWVGNDDRADNLDNILISTSVNNKKILAIDYGNAFNGPQWEHFDLECFDIIQPPFDGAVYSCLKNKVIGEDPFNDICSKIENIRRVDIEKIISQIPEEWTCSSQDRLRICNFLDNRKSMLRLFLNDIKNIFVYWRG